VPTVTDILVELEKPGRDPRPAFKTASFREGVEKLEDLQPGMVLEGVVTNVAAFGAFIDLGVHQDGLVHISAMANAYVKDPRTIAKPGDVVRVKVLEVDPKRRRVSLTMRLDQALEARPATAAQKSPQRDRRNASDPLSCVQAEAIPGPSAAMRWLRRFGERGRRARPQGGHSATGLCATILTACGFHLRAIPAICPCSWSRTPRVSGAARRQARQAHSFAKPAEPPRCAPTAMSSIWSSAIRAGLNRSVFPDPAESFPDERI
jgi:predicted RNA-binding protein with RPS1 domain